MREPARHDAVVTPEAVALDVDVAGLGSRMIATIIDTAIQAGVGLAIGLSFVALSGTGFPETPGTVLFFVLLFLVVWGYYPLFEGIWSGRTPGKRAQHLRVVLTDGQPVTAGPVLVRNLVRFVDYLPGAYAIGALTILLTRRSQRLGDLAAGTIVVRERPAPLPATVGQPRAESGDPIDASGLDTTGLPEHEYDLVRSFLQRRDALEQGARDALARQLAEAVAPKVGGVTERMSPEDFLEAVARSYRARFR